MKSAYKNEDILSMNGISEKYMKQVGEAWNKKNNIQGRKAWWNSEQIIRHINYLVCGEKIDGWNAGAIRCLKAIRSKYVVALSIGCGTANKEMQLLEQGIVDKFVCFELSEERIEIGQQQAIRKGIEGRIEFYKEDFFTSEYRNMKFDLVFWDNSLHHMPDVYDAVKVSKEVLKQDGIFFCNDYIGESRFQWSDEKLNYVNQIRDNLEESLFITEDRIFFTKDNVLQRHKRRPTIERMMETDPSEAADSENILPAINEYFKNPKITMLGGVVYMLALDRIIENIPENSDLLEKLILEDAAAMQKGMSLYAFVLARKDDKIIAE